MFSICFVIKLLLLASFSKPSQFKKGSILLFAVCIPAGYLIFFVDVITLFEGC